MTYRVFWSPDAERRLESLVRNASDSELISSAARQIDWNLVADPLNFGESRFETVRVGFEQPLGVQFDVLEDVRTVIVYEVWRIDRG